MIGIAPSDQALTQSLLLSVLTDADETSVQRHKTARQFGN